MFQSKRTNASSHFLPTRRNTRLKQKNFMLFESYSILHLLKWFLLQPIHSFCALRCQFICDVTIFFWVIANIKYLAWPHQTKVNDELLLCRFHALPRRSSCSLRMVPSLHCALYFAYAIFPLCSIVCFARTHSHTESLIIPHISFNASLRIRRPSHNKQLSLPAPGVTSCFRAPENFSCRRLSVTQFDFGSQWNALYPQ